MTGKTCSAGFIAGSIPLIVQEETLHVCAVLVFGMHVIRKKTRQDRSGAAAAAQQMQPGQE